MFNLCVVFVSKLPDPEARELEGIEPLSQIGSLISQSSCPRASEMGSTRQLTTESYKLCASWEVGHQENGLGER